MSEGNDNPQDPRPEFFGNYIIKALKVKSEKWFRLMVTEEQGTKVYNFLDNPECIVLIIFQAERTLKEQNCSDLLGSARSCLEAIRTLCKVTCAH
ncbi:hypothetical protein QTP88_006904 [Uroleucon formosanum]